LIGTYLVSALVVYGIIAVSHDILRYGCFRLLPGEGERRGMCGLYFEAYFHVDERGTRVPTVALMVAYLDLHKDQLAVVGHAFKPDKGNKGGFVHHADWKSVALCCKAETDHFDLFYAHEGHLSGIGKHGVLRGTTNGSMPLSAAEKISKFGYFCDFSEKAGAGTRPVAGYPATDFEVVRATDADMAELTNTLGWPGRWLPYLALGAPKQEHFAAFIDRRRLGLIECPGQKGVARGGEIMHEVWALLTRSPEAQP
jgi:hypothetical protein